MTSRTRAGRHSGVIKHAIFKVSSRAVAHVASIGRDRVPTWIWIILLPLCNDTVVARHADSNDLRMINGRCRFPNRGVVAVFAKVSSQNMTSVLAGHICVGTIMATDAITDDTRVIKLGRQPCRRAGVAGFAGIAADDVIFGFTCSLHTVVTIRTTSRDARVIER